MEMDLRERIADALARTYEGQPLADLRDEHAADHQEAAEAVMQILSRMDPPTTVSPA